MTVWEYDKAAVATSRQRARDRKPTMDTREMMKTNTLPPIVAIAFPVTRASQKISIGDANSLTLSELCEDRLMWMLVTSMHAHEGENAAREDKLAVGLPPWKIRSIEVCLLSDAHAVFPSMWYLEGMAMRQGSYVEIE